MGDSTYLTVSEKGDEEEMGTWMVGWLDGWMVGWLDAWDAWINGVSTVVRSTKVNAHDKAPGKSPPATFAVVKVAPSTVQ